MSVLLVIPARYGSTRFPGKPLVPLRGPDGSKSLIRRTWEAACLVPDIARVVVATDDPRIADHASQFGAQVVMTSSRHRNGTERCAEVARDLPEHDIVVNFQGDAPLVPPWFISDILAALASDAEVSMATPVLAADGAARQMLLADRAAGRVGGTTAVFGADLGALYFSKEVIPFAADPATPIHHHVGVYAYRRAALLAYAGWPEGQLEALEGLEQLRFLERGARLRCVPVDARGRTFWELNNPQDVPRIEALLMAAE